MKNLIVIVAILLCFSTSQAQETKPTKDEKIALQMPFYENLSAAKQNGNWGFVDKKSVWIIKPTFKDVSFFVKGYALVLKPNKDFAFINKSGKEFEIGDVASADENGIWWYECKQNKIWFGCLEGGEIIKVK
jgi:hypothetical protein